MEFIEQNNRIHREILRVSASMHKFANKHCLFFNRLAVHAARQPESELSFVGLIGLYNIVKKSDECETQFNGELATTIFNVFTDALMKYDANIG